MVALKAGLRGRGFDATLTVSTILRIVSAVFVVLIIIVTFDFGQQSALLIITTTNIARATVQVNG